MSDSTITAIPIRTASNGDAAVKVVDGTTPSQALGVDSSGRVTIKLDDGSGNAITSQVNGAARALDVGINVAGVQIDPRAIRALTATDVVTANQGAPAVIANAWYVRPTDGTNSQAYTAAGEAKISLTEAIPAGSNTIGAVTQASGPWTQNLTQVGGSAIALGQTTMLASLPVVIASNQSTLVTSDLADGSVAGGTAGTKSMLAGSVYNSSPLTLTTGQQASLQSDVNGYLNVDLKTAIPAGANLIGAVNLDLAGSPVSGTNPIPVSITSSLVGTAVNNYNTASAVAANGTSNHTYTITSSKTFNGKKIFASASGKLKIEVQVSPDGSTYSTLFVGFSSTANPNISIDMNELVFLESGAGSTVRIIRTNLDILPFDVYSTISGTEV